MCSALTQIKDNLVRALMLEGACLYGTATVSALRRSSRRVRPSGALVKVYSSFCPSASICQAGLVLIPRAGGGVVRLA